MFLFLSKENPIDVTLFDFYEQKNMQIQIQKPNCWSQIKKTYITSTLGWNKTVYNLPVVSDPC